MAKQKEVKCPFCASHVKKKDVTGGRSELRLPFFDPPLRIPLPPFLAKTIKPKPDKCTCEGKQKIKDVTDDSSKYQQLAQKAQHPPRPHPHSTGTRGVQYRYGYG